MEALALSLLGSISSTLLAAFTLVGPKSVKRHCWLNCLFALLGSGWVKAACRMLMKLTPGLGINFTDTLLADFTREDSKSAKNTFQVVSLFWAFGICVRKMLVKLTPDVHRWPTASIPDSNLLRWLLYSSFSVEILVLGAQTIPLISALISA